MQVGDWVVTNTNLLSAKLFFNELYLGQVIPHTDLIPPSPFLIEILEFPVFKMKRFWFLENQLLPVNQIPSDEIGIILSRLGPQSASKLSELIKNASR